MVSEEVEDLSFFCALYHREQREKEGLEALHELIALDPVFDKHRRGLFQVIYKSVIDSLRNSLRVLTDYQNFEAERGRSGHVVFLTSKRESLSRQLLAHSRDAVSAIDTALLPNSGDSQTTVFFHKLKGDFYRYMAEHSDESDAIAAGNSAEDSYTTALAIANEALPSHDTVRLALVLNAAIFKYEIRKDTEIATEMLERAVGEHEGNVPEMDSETQREFFEIIAIIRQNLEVWADGNL
jgi:14-3-3 protein epsilon